MKAKSNDLQTKINAAFEMLEFCSLCGHRCGVNRLKDERGICQAPKEVYVSSYTVHHGEEPFFSGKNGSGTIFFTYCNLSCIFCQNYQISQEHMGKKVSDDELSDIMIILQNKGCHNVNLVSPTHFMPMILKALSKAVDKGLKLPIIYNTNGYDSSELLTILDGVVDIYMPDFKYVDDEKAKKYSNAENYFETAKTAIKEMFRQTGNLKTDENNIAKKGILVRHLVLPGNTDDSKRVLDYLASISRDMWVSIMSQYSPQNKAFRFNELNRTICLSEYYSVVEYAKNLGINNLLIQEISSNMVYLPDFNKDEPF